MPDLAAIDLGGTVEPWRPLGFSIEGDPPRFTVGSVACRFDIDSAVGLHGLRTVGLLAPIEVDGLAFSPAEPTPAGPAHPNGAFLVDHVVVMTSSLERTCGAVESVIGAPLRRIRDVAPGVRQGFHRLGEVILEVVETPQVASPTASLWGLVFVVEDLEGWAAGLGPDVCSPPKDAVQRGRRISNVRAAAGLGLPVAFMSPG